MQKIILSDGKVINVDIPPVEGRHFRALQTAIMIDDSMALKEVWYYEFQRDHQPMTGGTDHEYEYIGELKSDKELTKEELIFEMAKRGLRRFDIVIPHKAYMLDFVADN